MKRYCWAASLTMGMLLASSYVHGQFGFFNLIDRSDMVDDSNFRLGEQALATADLDGDGLEDVVMKSFRGPVWYKALASGGFSPAVLIAESTSECTLDVLAVDLDGDGLADIVCNNADGSQLVWYRNLGSGSFASMPAVISSLSSCENSVDAFDMDVDGDMDIVLIYRIGGFGARWFANDGLGDFVPSQSFYPTNPPQSGVADFHFGDLDGDGDIDMVFLKLNSVERKLMLSKRNNPSFFALPVELNSMPESFCNFELGDVDGNGAADIVHMNDTSIRFMLNDGSATFTVDPLELPAFVDRCSMALLDLNEDGRLDVVIRVASDAVRPMTYTYINNSGSALSFLEPVVTYESEPGTLTAWTPQGGGQASLLVREFNYLKREVLDLDANQWTEEILSSQVPESILKAADLSGDGRLDLVGRLADAPGLTWYEQTEDNGFTTHFIADSLTFYNGFHLADVDADGTTDLLAWVRPIGSTTNELPLVRFRYDGDSMITIVDTLFTNFTSGFPVLSLTDIDGDADVDAMIWDPGLQRFVILRNNGAGTFSIAGELYISALPLGYRLYFLDITGDGASDLIVYGSQTFDWYANDGSGAFTPMPELMTLTTSFGVHRLFDMDGDGLTDVLYDAGSTYNWLRNTGMGSLELGGPLLPVEYGEAYQGEMDGDGLLDILVVQEARVFWFKHLGGGVYEQSSNTILEGNLTGAYLEFPNVVADIGQDGDMDFILRTKRTPGYQMHLAYQENFASNSGVRGKVYLDTDANGSFGPGDVPLSQRPVGTSPDERVFHSATNGDYAAFLGAGVHTLSMLQEGVPEGWSIVEGGGGHTVELGSDQIVNGYDFGWVPTVDQSSIAVTAVMGAAPCSAQNRLTLSFENRGTRIEKGTVSLTLPFGIGFVSSDPEPTLLNGNPRVWEFDSLSYFEARSIAVNITMPPFSFIGQTLTYTVTVNTMDDQGLVIGTFSETYDLLVTCSYDPNDKQVEPAGYGDAGAVDIATEYVDYTIRFQNTGTAPAFGVKIEDLLDPKLDPARFRMIAYSHEPTHISIGSDGKLTVEFLSIMLPPMSTSVTESQGFLTFRIALLPSQPHLTEITNCASIFFDLNEPIVTNTTRTTLVDCDLWEPVIMVPTTDLLEASEGDAYSWFFNDEPIAGANERWLAIDAVGEYRVEVTSAYGCTALSAPITIITLDLDERSTGGFLVLPNPFNEQTVLLFPHAVSSQHKVEMVDVHGKRVFQGSGQGGRELQLTGAGLPAGVYILRVFDPTGGLIGTARLVGL